MTPGIWACVVIGWLLVLLLLIERRDYVTRDRKDDSMFSDEEHLP